MQLVIIITCATYLTLLVLTLYWLRRAITKIDSVHSTMCKLDQDINTRHAISPETDVQVACNVSIDVVPCDEEVEVNMPQEEFVMYILVNQDVKMSKGKTAAQVAHAACKYLKLELMCNYDSNYGTGLSQLTERWFETGQKKIVLKASEELILSLEQKAGKCACATCTRQPYAGCPGSCYYGEECYPCSTCDMLYRKTVTIRDNGHTQVAPNTLTACCLGIGTREDFATITGDLPLL